MKKKIENWVNWKQQKTMKTLWPEFDFHWIYSLKVDGDSDKIWKFSETDHTHFFAPEVRQISQNFSWEPFWLLITPHGRRILPTFYIGSG